MRLRIEKNLVGKLYNICEYEMSNNSENSLALQNFFKLIWKLSTQLCVQEIFMVPLSSSLLHADGSDISYSNLFESAEVMHWESH